MISHTLALGLALLIVAPPIGYQIPVVVNSFAWLYSVIVCGLFGMLFMFQKAHRSIKMLAVYLFLAAFVSQAPFLSFNAFMLTVAVLYAFLAFQKADFTIITKYIEAAFWVQFIVVCFQLLGMDTLLNFGSDKKVFLGTVMQYMRLSSVLVIMAPFLMLKRPIIYGVALAFLCIASQSSSFALSLIIGATVYAWIMLATDTRSKLGFVAVAVIAVISYAMYDYHSWRGAIIESNGGRLISWKIAFITWFTDTSAQTGANFTGPFNIKWFLIGHGADTFLPLFPVYKHDINPFGQAHNCWIQLLWEIGLVGFGLIAWYTVALIRRLYKNGHYKYIAGLAIIGANMFFAFPTRMTQTAVLIVAYLALCETKKTYTQSVLKKNNWCSVDNFGNIPNEKESICV